MPARTAKSYVKWILSACVLTALASCGSTNVVTKTVTVEVPVPVLVPLHESLLKIHAPRYLYPTGSMPVAALEDKVEALEIALGLCNNDKELIRAAQPASSRSPAPR